MEEVLVSERKKYQQCYALETYHLQGARLARVKQDIDKIPMGATYIDVGCGRGEMVARAAARGVAAVGRELVPELCGRKIVEHPNSPDQEIPYYILEGSVTDMSSFGDGQFEYVSCYDMIEHLPPELVDDALDELFRICASVLYITTNEKQSRLPLPEGKFLELHLTRMPRAWWDEKLSSRAADRSAKEVIETEYGHDEWHWEIHL